MNKKKKFFLNKKVCKHFSSLPPSKEYGKQFSKKKKKKKKKKTTHFWTFCINLIYRVIPLPPKNRTHKLFYFFYKNKAK